ncbi:52 kDa repressor of the inhibitor of the protein kinase-like [Cydia pomonella]|uniref:52 kDa repressor of the inhibitor of the protein kinase-like n=1 Tax=Cydia pomonella TaxID=82600 RepID=UPI002ADD4D2D|nr:52 kDa repressor of the inhibitor of the protein kinase-like [Cydia pomonella]
MASKPNSRSNPYKRYCSVYGCLNKRKNKEAEITFFKIPVDIERRQEWLTAIDREDLLDEKKLKKAKNNFVCSAHFDESTIITSTSKRLKNDAAPTILLPEKSQKNIPPDALPQTSTDMLTHLHKPTKKDKILVPTYSHNQSQTDTQEQKGIESEIAQPNNNKSFNESKPKSTVLSNPKTNALQSHKKVRILSNKIIKIKKPELTCTSMQTDLIETSNKMTQTTLALSDKSPRKRKLKKELVTDKCQRKRLEQEVLKI